MAWRAVLYAALIAILLVSYRVDAAATEVNHETQENKENPENQLNIPPSELSALQDLYISTTGDNWDWKEGAGSVWNFTGHPNPCYSEWQGIVCASNASVDSAYVHVKELLLSTYNLVGRVPASIVNLTKVEQLELDQNSLSGTITPTYATLSHLLKLSLFSNRISGTIPSILGTMSQLKLLFLSGNLLSGTIPSSLGSLDFVEGLDLGGNYLTGTIPVAIGNMSHLEQIDIFDNDISGSIPWQLGNLGHLTEMFLYINKLTGIIPASLGQLNNLNVLAVEMNLLTGSMPSSFSNLDLLELLDIGQNRLTGSIPAGFSNLIQMAIIDFDTNLLSGTIPSFLKNWANLLVLDLDSNILTGTIPSTLGELKKLIVLDFVSNRLSGSIPTSISQLESLQYLTFFHNSLEGSLEGIFNSSIQKSLFQIDLYDNQFSGSLPSELFHLPALSIVSLASNCFTGTLPSDICNALQLEFLVVDGLHTSSSCRRRIWTFSDSYIIKDGFHGTIPSCIFALPQVKILHLSGNGFSGTLPANVMLQDSFHELLLSHNSLTGSIPLAFQTHAWSKMDLSYNRLSHSLTADFGKSMRSNATVYIQNNRLSGLVPSFLVNLLDVSALGSNMFSCSAGKSDIPQHDNSYSNYQCGSDAFNDPWYAFLAFGLVFSVAIIVVICWPEIWWLFRRLRVDLDKYSVHKSSLPLACQQVYTMVEILCHLATNSTIGVLLVFVPWYSAASHYWGTYTHSYAWVVSAAFKSGLAPGVAELILFTAMLSAVAVAAVFFGNCAKRSGFELMSQSSLQSSSKVSSHNSAQMYVFVVVVNLVVVVGANIAFVSVALTQSSAVLTISQIILSVFKFLWNAVYVRALVTVSISRSDRVEVTTGFFAVQTFIGVVNNIIVPCLVVAVLNPSCFYSVFNTPDSVESSYYLNSCTPSGAGIVCFEVDDTVIYLPPFIYDYQCSSSFITYYAPTFVYLSIMAAMVAPAVHMLTLFVLNTAQPDTLLHRLCVAILPVFLRPSSYSGFLHKKIIVFDANHWLSVLLIYFGILLTFGVVFPPLAAAMCFTMMSVAWQMKLSVGRLIGKSKEVSEEQFQQVHEKLKEDCIGVASIEKLGSGLALLLGSAFCFYALFVFDTVGDEEGFAGAYWVLIVMPVTIICMIVVAATRRFCFESRSFSNSDTNPGAYPSNGRVIEEVEMKFAPNTNVPTVRESGSEITDTQSALHA